MAHPVQFWLQIGNQRPRKPPYTKFRRNREKLRICTNIAAILDPLFRILQFWHQILNLPILTSES